MDTIKNCSEAIAEVLKSEIRDRIVVKSIEANGLAKSFLKVRFEKAVQDYKNGKNRTCHQLISHPEKIEKRAEKPLKIILL